MLYDIEKHHYIINLPYKRDFEVWKSRLTEVQYDSIIDELNSRIDTDEIHTSSWIPGSDWRGTVFQPIYEDACEYNGDSAAKFFGLILFKVIMDRDDVWSFGRYKKGNIPIRGLTYFKLKNTPINKV